MEETAQANPAVKACKVHLGAELEVIPRNKWGLVTFPWESN